MTAVLVLLSLLSVWTLSLLSVWTLVSDRPARWSITAPLTFALVGVVLVVPGGGDDGGPCSPAGPSRRVCAHPPWPCRS
ncbi:hypothetical protein ACFV0D_18600 [Streptomyces sp. NPDC059556]|uniref:hypothetical protein n=1 Tax=Streptomyces sp. NPDC059556 TaxID=3346863 RepID=UPI0036D0F272